MRLTPEYETRIVVDGAEYHAQTAMPGAPAWMGRCDDCAFHRSHGCVAPRSHAAMPCTGSFRTDKTSIIWVKA